VATLVWDQIGERTYQTGIDRGVLYLHDGTVAVWNGLIDIEESSVSELKSFYLDGVKYLENLIPGDFLGKLKAFTYPEEFDLVSGVVNIGTSPGMVAYDQPAKSFNLSYRTIIGNDIEGEEYGYKIHLLYNVFANPDSHSFGTLQDTVRPVEFSWSLSGTPPKLTNFRPTVHVSIDSRETPSYILEVLEDMLYGTEVNDPRLPPIQEIAEFFGYLGALLIVDHGGGVWSAIDESDTYITMIDSTTFQIDNADTTYLDANTYEISSTNIGEQS
jgi:hypothetical protein